LKPPILTKAGIPFPSADPKQALTWEQLKADGAEAQAKGGAKSGFLFEDTALYATQLGLIASAGGGTGITGADGLSANVNNAGWNKAMTWYASLFASGESPRGTGTLGTDAYFASGNAAYFASGPWSVGAFLPGGWAAASANWGVAPLPHFAGGKAATTTGAWSWGINPVSKNKEADLKFIKFASLSAAGNYDTVKTTTIIPSNLTAAAKYFPTLEQSAGTHGTGLAEILTYQNKVSAFARPKTVGYLAFETTMNKAISDIVNGADVSTTLAKANSDVKTAFASLK